jgi:hypothetical protein
MEKEDQRDKESIEKSDEDWAAQDQEGYDSDEGFVVSDDHVSYSERYFVYLRNLYFVHSY